MKINKYILSLSIFTFLFCCINNLVLADNLDSLYQPFNSVKRYKVLKIKSRKNIYIIYAEKNDTLFKIVSRKEKINSSTRKRIHRKGVYSFSLETLFPRFLMGIEFPPPGSTGRMGKYYYGVTVSLEPEKEIWDLFEATNLKGLYIEEEDIPSN